MRWKSNQDITPTFSIEFGKYIFFREIEIPITTMHNVEKKDLKFV